MRRILILLGVVLPLSVTFAQESTPPSREPSEVLEILKSLTSKLEDVHRAAIQRGPSTLTNDLNDIKNALTSLKSEMDILRQDITTIKQATKK